MGNFPHFISKVILVFLTLPCPEVVGGWEESTSNLVVEFYSQFTVALDPACFQSQMREREGDGKTTLF